MKAESFLDSEDAFAGSADDFLGADPAAGLQAVSREELTEDELIDIQERIKVGIDNDVPDMEALTILKQDPRMKGVLPNVLETEYQKGLSRNPDSQMPKADLGPPKAATDDFLDEGGSLVDQAIAGGKSMVAAFKTKRLKSLADAINDKPLERYGQQGFGAQGILRHHAETGKTQKWFAEGLKEVEDLTGEAEAVKFSPETLKLFESETPGDIWEALTDSPMKTANIIAEIGARSAAPSLASMATGAVGGVVAGPTGFAAGLGAGSGQVEYMNSILAGLREHGADLNDPESVLAVFDDDEAMAAIAKKATIRGVSIGALDAITGGVATKTFGGTFTNLAFQTVVQGTGGGTGEAIAQVASGEELQLGEIAAEVVGEMVTAPVDVAAATYSTATKPSELETEIDKAFDENATVVRPDVASQLLDPDRAQVVLESATVDEAIESAAEVVDISASIDLEAEIVEPEAALPEVPQTSDDFLNEIAPELPPVEFPDAGPETFENEIAPEVQPLEFTDEIVEELPEEPATESTLETDLDGSKIETVEVPLDQLTLSDDIPQFKSGASSETGVVEPLGGEYKGRNPGMAPIVVWERLDGKLEIATGRHRADLARRSGETSIPSHVLKEADGWTAKKLAIMDAENNLLGGQGKVKDYVTYFSKSEISKEEADSRGLLGRAKGQRAFEIADAGSPELVTAHRNDQVTDAQAYAISLNAPSDSAVQAVGIKAAMDGKSTIDLVNLMKAVISSTPQGEQGADMFGFDDSAMKAAEEMAKIASRKQREISNDLTTLTGATKAAKMRPDIAKKFGVKVKDKEGLKKIIGKLRETRSSWENWHTNPELKAEIDAEMNPLAAVASPTAGYNALSTEDQTFVDRRVQDAHDAIANDDAGDMEEAFLEYAVADSDEIPNNVYREIKNILMPDQVETGVGSYKGAPQRGMLETDGDMVLADAGVAKSVLETTKGDKAKAKKIILGSMAEGVFRDKVLSLVEADSASQAESFLDKSDPLSDIDLSAIRIPREVTEDETGDVYEVFETADVLLRRMDKRTDMIRQLAGCMAG
jgi:hypothetical protein